MASLATLSNFLEELGWTQNHPQYLSGWSRALFPTTFPEIAVYVWIIIIDVEAYPAAIIWFNGASKSVKQYYTASAPLGHGPRKNNEDRYVLTSVKYPLSSNYPTFFARWTALNPSQKRTLVSVRIMPIKVQTFLLKSFKDSGAKSSPAKCLSGPTKERILNHVDFSTPWHLWAGQVRGEPHPWKIAEGF